MWRAQRPCHVACTEATASCLSKWSTPLREGLTKVAAAMLDGSLATWKASTSLDCASSHRPAPFNLDSLDKAMRAAARSWSKAAARCCTAVNTLAHPTHSASFQFSSTLEHILLNTQQARISIPLDAPCFLRTTTIAPIAQLFSDSPCHSGTYCTACPSTPS